MSPLEVLASVYHVAFLAYVGAHAAHLIWRWIA